MKIKSHTKNAVVIGAGVSGLTTAFILSKEGYKVSIVAESVGIMTESASAGALWEMPPAVCGFVSQPENSMLLKYLSLIHI